MAASLTVGERIIFHLSQYAKYHDSYDVPIDISQDGIAAALRISRAHAALELKKLKDTKDVAERLSHIKKGRTKRKAYFLTPQGGEEGQGHNAVRGCERHRSDTLPGHPQMQGAGAVGRPR